MRERCSQNWILELRVVLTQPQPRVTGLAANLGAAGHEVATLSFQRVVERTGEPRVARQLLELDSADWIIPVSPNAVEVLAAFLSTQAATLTAQIALIGPGSLERWQQSVASAARLDEMPQPLLPRSGTYDAAALISEPPLQAVSGKRVVIIQAGERRASWADELLKRGAKVTVIAAYSVEAIAPTSDEALHLISWLNDTGKADFPIMLASSVAIADVCSSWLRHSLPVDWQHAIGQCLWLVNHPRIEKFLRREGWEQVKTIVPGERGLLEALESLS